MQKDSRKIPDWPPGYPGDEGKPEKYSQSNWLSYYHHLMDEVERTSPRAVLEWGTGASTIFLAERCPLDTKIISIDSDRSWIVKVRTYLESNDMGGNVKHVHIDDEYGPYASWPLLHDYKFDLIFIDGYRRVDCAAVASVVLEEHGSVVLHDAYMPELYEHHHVSVLFGDEKLYYSPLPVSEHGPDKRPRVLTSVLTEPKGKVHERG